jgi:hypothetical protein
LIAAALDALKRACSASSFTPAKIAGTSALKKLD